MMLVNMREGGFVSAHDYEVGLAIARVMCGGDVDSGSLVDERWLLALEREEFMRLLATEKTQARIAHTLATGKPLRN
jgi:3-hydroxyacyl-CoA dehydrogenase